MKENTITKPANVVMLATDKPSNIGYYTATYGEKPLQYRNTIPLSHWVDCQHLYFTTDEEIKEGDWYLHGNDNSLCLDKNDAHGMCSCKKIVATTDPELWTKIPIEGQEGHFLNKPLAKVPESFIKSYVDKQGKIDKVMIEIVNDLYESDYMKEKLKLTSKGEVIIHPLKKKMYTREEVREAISDFHNSCMTQYFTEGELNEWFDENYPNISISSIAQSINNGKVDNFLNTLKS